MMKWNSLHNLNISIGSNATWYDMYVYRLNINGYLKILIQFYVKHPIGHRSSWLHCIMGCIILCRKCCCIDAALFFFFVLFLFTWSCPGIQLYAYKKSAYVLYTVNSMHSMVCYVWESFGPVAVLMWWHPVIMWICFQIFQTGFLLHIKHVVNSADLNVTKTYLRVVFDCIICISCNDQHISSCYSMHQFPVKLCFWTFNGLWELMFFWHKICC